MLMKFTNALVKSRPLREIGAEQVRARLMNMRSVHVADIHLADH
jgi:hypothetical protein